jgi:hypothetical protein
MPSDLLRDAELNLTRLKDALTAVSLKYADIEPSATAVAVGVAFGDTDFVVVTISGPPNDTTAYLTTPILKDLDHDDRPDILEVCNELTGNNAAFPTFLHDAEIGWDVLIQDSLPVQVLVDVPAFFHSCVTALPPAAEYGRTKFGEKGIRGDLYRWNQIDVDRLFRCSYV